jgi:hypothetical protein
MKKNFTFTALILACTFLGSCTSTGIIVAVGAIAPVIYEETRINKLYSIDIDNMQRKCIVDLSVKTKEWHRLEGEYIYGTNISEDEACKKEKINAMKKFVDNNFNSLVTNVQLINCSEVQADRETLEIDVGKKLPNEEWLSIWNSMDGKTKDDFITSIFLLIF